MKRLSRILPVVLAAVLIAVPFFGQAQDGTVTGRVLDRDGKTPLVGATIVIDQLATNSGRIVVRETLQTKTGREGRYNMSGLYIGRVRVSVVVNNQKLGNARSPEITGAVTGIATDGLTCTRPVNCKTFRNWPFQARRNLGPIGGWTRAVRA